MTRRPGVSWETPGPLCPHSSTTGFNSQLLSLLSEWIVPFQDVSWLSEELMDSERPSPFCNQLFRGLEYSMGENAHLLSSKERKMRQICSRGVLFLNSLLVLTKQNKTLGWLLFHWDHTASFTSELGKAVLNLVSSCSCGIHPIIQNEPRLKLSSNQKHYYSTLAAFHHRDVVMGIAIYTNQRDSGKQTLVQSFP